MGRGDHGPHSARNRQLLAELVVGITDQTENISQASYYAKHSIAGIIRNVRIFAVPKSHLSDLGVIASFDNKQTGEISVKATLSSEETTEFRLRFTLRDPAGQIVELEPASEPFILRENPARACTSRALTQAVGL